MEASSETREIELPRDIQEKLDELESYDALYDESYDVFLREIRSNMLVNRFDRLRTIGDGADEQLHNIYRMYLAYLEALFSTYSPEIAPTLVPIDIYLNLWVKLEQEQEQFYFALMAFRMNKRSTVDQLSISETLSVIETYGTDTKEIAIIRSVAPHLVENFREFVAGKLRNIKENLTQEIKDGRSDVVAIELFRLLLWCEFISHDHARILIYMFTMNDIVYPIEEPDDTDEQLRYITGIIEYYDDINKKRFANPNQAEIDAKTEELNLKNVQLANEQYAFDRLKEAMTKKKERLQTELEAKHYEMLDTIRQRKLTRAMDMTLQPVDSSGSTRTTPQRRRTYRSATAKTKIKDDLEIQKLERKINEEIVKENHQMETQWNEEMETIDLKHRDKMKPLQRDVYKIQKILDKLKRAPLKKVDLEKENEFVISCKYLLGSLALEVDEGADPFRGALSETHKELVRKLQQLIKALQPGQLDVVVGFRNLCKSVVESSISDEKLRIYDAGSKGVHSLLCYYLSEIIRTGRRVNTKENLNPEGFEFTLEALFDTGHGDSITANSEKVMYWWKKLEISTQERSEEEPMEISTQERSEEEPMDDFARGVGRMGGRRRFQQRVSEHLRRSTIGNSFSLKMRL